MVPANAYVPGENSTDPYLTAYILKLAKIFPAYILKLAKKSPRITQTLSKLLLLCCVSDCVILCSGS